MISYIHYTDNLPTNVGGSAKGPFIRIKHKYKNDKGIHAHEQAHVNQWWFWVLIGIMFAGLLSSQGYVDGAVYAFGVGVNAHMLFYTFIDRYKLFCEVQAYRIQLGYYSDDRSLLFAQFISEHYGLKITTDEAYRLLKRGKT